MNMAGHQSGGSYMNMQSEPKCSRLSPPYTQSPITSWYLNRTTYLATFKSQKPPPRPRINPAKIHLNH
ncbi:uncharacterized protein Dyak_GE27408, isoform B [Drosophila yakuba]|uniref:Uncharacterized protein, isoform A n=1 Tax=Drosophila yakuba TaxID=7245 RepID=A0A0R1EI32_DROYA|nr:uncharacterized protein Dyak_GE27408, isoform A [Drosophila yakuba]KRK06731.1 uncharacterized protein Dyak_GE27408, isoform B [Drosophila yakuba]